MSFWDPQSEEPLRQYRWYLLISKGETRLDKLKISLKECSKPEYEIGVSEHKLLNHTFRYPGIAKWKPVTVKFISSLSSDSDMEADAGQIFFDYLYNYFYNSSFSRQFLLNEKQNPFILEGIGKRKIFDVSSNTSNEIDIYTDDESSSTVNISEFNTKENIEIIDIELIQIAGDGYELEKWKLYNCWFSNVNFGNLSYDSEDFVTISATLQYDWAEKGLRKPRPIKDKDNTKPSSAQQTLPAQTATNVPAQQKPVPPATTPAVAQQEVPTRQPPLPAPTASPVPQAQQVDSPSKTATNVPAQQKPVPPATTPAVAQQEVPTRQPPLPAPPQLSPPPLDTVEGEVLNTTANAVNNRTGTGTGTGGIVSDGGNRPPGTGTAQLSPPPLVNVEDDNTLTSSNNPAFPSSTAAGVVSDGGNRPPGTGTTQLSPPPLVRAEDDNTLTSFNNPAFPSSTGTNAGTGTSSGTGTSTGTGGIVSDGGNRPSGTGTGTNNNRGTGTGNGGNLNRYANSGYPTGENPNKGSDTSSILVPLDSSSSTPLGYYTIGLSNRRYSFESGTAARVNSAIERYNRSEKTDKDYKEYERSVKQAAEDDAKRNRRIGF